MESARPVGTKESLRLELRVPTQMLEAARAYHTTPSSDDDWHQCDVVDCGRWYQRARGVAIQANAQVHLEGREAPSFTVAVYELRWACPFCSESVNGLELSHTDKFRPIVARAAGAGAEEGADGARARYAPPCDWCRDQELNTCSKAEHDKMDWDGDAEHDYTAAGVQLPPSWIAGFRTRSTDLKPYKVFLMSCTTCGEVIQPDRAKRVLAHLNSRDPSVGLPSCHDGMRMACKHGVFAHNPSTGQRACIVPELDYLLCHASGPAGALDPGRSVEGSAELEKVFKFKPRRELAEIATALHRDLIHAISGDEALRAEAFADLPDFSAQNKMLAYAQEMVARMSAPNFGKTKRKIKGEEEDSGGEIDFSPQFRPLAYQGREPAPGNSRRQVSMRELALAQPQHGGAYNGGGHGAHSFGSAHGNHAHGAHGGGGGGGGGAADDDSALALLIAAADADGAGGSPDGQQPSGFHRQPSASAYVHGGGAGPGAGGGSGVPGVPGIPADYGARTYGGGGGAGGRGGGGGYDHSPTTSYERKLKRRTNGASLADSWRDEPRPGATHVRPGGAAAASGRPQMSPGLGGGGGRHNGAHAAAAMGARGAASEVDVSSAEAPTLRQLVASLRQQLRAAHTTAAREMAARHVAEASAEAAREEASIAADAALLSSARADKAEASLRQWLAAWGDNSKAGGVAE
ncbi:hypothetical protein FOA52_007104 [Chlamydomonas sp. UWO 241]|nr:hypothetical protein FOA52_007104 [Chlamydomonas sp. UWO 241]